MSFASLHFLVFFAVVFVTAWKLSPCLRARNRFLLVASYYFYMSWNPWYAGLIAASTVVDFLIGMRLHRAVRGGGVVTGNDASSARARKAWLVASIVFNLGVLFVFKYFNFFVSSVIPSVWPGLDGTGWVHRLLLPVGISFYTFQTMSYTIDIYRRRLEPTKDLAEFALFVSFFPQLVAGPIVRATTFLPQLRKDPLYREHRIQSGFIQILTGLGKKLLLADVIGRALVDPVFADPSSYHSGSLLLAAYAYAFQIYYDFSGYSDVAIGAGRMLGFDLPVNFNHPFRAVSLREFWRRWHISLSTWLRDYLYVPLGGSRYGGKRTAINLALVMVLGGLWHGAAWGFVIWGILHGLFLGLERLMQKVFFNSAAFAVGSGKESPAIMNLLSWAVTFHIVVFCFIFFRAESTASAGLYLDRLLELTWGGGELPPIGLVFLAIAAALEWHPRRLRVRTGRAYRRLPFVGQAVTVAVSLLAFMVFANQPVPFIYFQF